MPTVTSDETGEQVEVVQVKAVAAVASVNTLSSEMPAGAAKFIEQAMARAVQRCLEEGVGDQAAIREAMMSARVEAKTFLRMQMNDARSQET